MKNSCNKDKSPFSSRAPLTISPFSTQNREPFSEYAKARLNNEMVSPLAISKKLNEIGANSLGKQQLEEQNSPFLISLSSLMYNQFSSPTVSAFCSNEVEEKSQKNSSSRKLHHKDKENICLKAITSPFNEQNLNLFKGKIALEKMNNTSRISRNQEKKECQNTVNKVNYNFKQQEYIPPEITKLVDGKPSDQLENLSLSIHKEENIGKNIRKAIISPFQDLECSSSKSIQLSKDPKEQKYLVKNEGNENKERVMSTSVKRLIEKKGILDPTIFQINFKNFNLNFKEKLKQIKNKNCVSSSSIKQLPNIKTLCESNKLLIHDNNNNILKNRQEMLSPLPKKQKFSETTSPDLWKNFAGSPILKEINKIISPASFHNSSSSQKKITLPSKLNKYCYNKLDQNRSINLENCFKTDSYIPPLLVFTSPRTKGSLTPTLMSASTTKYSQNFNLGQSKCNFIPSTHSLCSLGVSECDEALSITQPSRPPSYRTLNNLINPSKNESQNSSKNESQQDFMITSLCQIEAQQSHKPLQIGFDQNMKRQISDSFGELKEGVRNMIESNQKWRAVVEIKLKMNIEQFLYLLQHFWMFCLNNNATYEFQVFRLEEKRVIQLERCIEETISKIDSVDLVTGSNFIYLFHTQSRKFILTSTIVNCLGGEENTFLLLNSFVESIKKGEYGGQALGVSGIQVCQTLASVIVEELGLKNKIKETIFHKFFDHSTQGECITQVEFFLAKRSLLLFLSDQKWIQKETKYLLIEKLEKKNPYIMQNYAQLRLLNDEGIHSTLVIKLRHCKLIVQNLQKREKQSLNQLSTDIFAMLFNKLQLRDFYSRMNSMFIKSDKIDDILNQLEQETTEVVKNYLNLTQSQLLIIHIQIKFKMLKQMFHKDPLIHVLNRGGTIIKKLRKWANINFKDYHKHISLTEEENSKMELMDSIILFYFHRKADVFSILDVSSALSHFPFTKNAFEFWLEGFQSVLSDETFQLKEDTKNYLFEEFKHLFDSLEQI